MNYKLLFLSFFLIFKNDLSYSQTQFSKSKEMLVDFNSLKSNHNWTIVDDVVMGGLSSSEIILNDQGNAVFKGSVSTENYGGFSSVRSTIPSINLKNFNCFVIRIKGDGKNYQFRVKSNQNDKHSYKYTFSTNSSWQEIVIPFKNLEPTFRGRKLNLPNFTNKFLEEIGFLISNKTDENFELEIDYIKLK